MVIEIQKSVAFVDQLAALTPDQWRAVKQPGLLWDAAWQHALAAGGLALAVRAMETARSAGAGLGRAALAGAAAAALDLELELTAAEIEALYAPFAAVLPRTEGSFRVWGPDAA